MPAVRPWSAPASSIRQTPERRPGAPTVAGPNATLSATSAVARLSRTGSNGTEQTAMHAARWQWSARLFGCALILATCQARAEDYQASYHAGSRDASGQYLGGTEMRLLVVHAGKLFAGNGYWEDRPGTEGAQPPQVLVLDTAAAPWRVDHAFADRLSNGRLRDLAVGALAEATFATDGAGRPLARPVSLLLASTWDLTGAARVFVRDDATGNWPAVTLAEDRPGPAFLPQIRAFGTHRDRVTGVDLVFAGEMPRGIFSGAYDAATPTRIRWSAAPELAASAAATDFPGLGGRLRVSSFAEANGRLYAAVGQQIFERTDGPAPSWKPVYTNPRPGHSETGLRGLTAIHDAGPEMLLAAVEGDAARLVRVDPATGAERTELDLRQFLSRQWGMQAGYVIAAYNDMTHVHLPVAGEVLLIGVMSFVPRGAAMAQGHALVDVGYGQVEGGAWYLVRFPPGRYELRHIAPPDANPMVAVRSIRVSPFPGEPGVVYFAGFDANKAPVHNTAWIVRSQLDEAPPVAAHGSRAP